MAPSTRALNLEGNKGNEDVEGNKHTFSDFSDLTTSGRIYNHLCNTVPTYVLDTLTRPHFRGLPGDSSTLLSKLGARSSHTGDDHSTFAHDYYVDRLDNDWLKFLDSVRDPTLAPRVYDSQPEKGLHQADLSTPWGGDARLREALVDDFNDDEDTFTEGTKFWFVPNWLRPKHSAPTRESEKPRLRSQAGYWMSDAKRAELLPTMRRMFLMNPLLPLFLRILILLFSLCALGLACTVFVYSRNHDGWAVAQQPSTIMAVAVQCVAVVYVVYIGYDEYSGKPLGLRDPLGKMKLIMLDLLFIIFSLANLLLAFNTLFADEWVCRPAHSSVIDGYTQFFPQILNICRRQRALVAFLFVLLCLWVLNFTVSIVRVVDRVSVPGPRLD